MPRMSYCERTKIPSKSRNSKITFAAISWDVRRKRQKKPILVKWVEDWNPHSLVRSIMYTKVHQILKAAQLSKNSFARKFAKIFLMNFRKGRRNYLMSFFYGLAVALPDMKILLCGEFICVKVNFLL